MVVFVFISKKMKYESGNEKKGMGSGCRDSVDQSVRIWCFRKLFLISSGVPCMSCRVSRRFTTVKNFNSLFR